VRPGDSARLAGALDGIVSDPSRIPDVSAREFVLRTGDLRAVAATYLELASGGQRHVP
jgi:hypothetical protein